MAFLSEAARYTRNSGYVGSVTTNYLASYPAGTLILLSVNATVPNAWTTMTVVDNAGNTYAIIGTPHQEQPSNFQVAQFYCVLTNPVTTSTVITASVNDRTPNLWSIVAAAFDDASVTLDITASAIGTNSTPNSGTATPTANKQLLFGTVAWTDNTGSVGLTAGSGWTNLTKATASPSANGRSLAIGYRYVDSSNLRSYTGTLASSQPWAAFVAAFTLNTPAGVEYTRTYQVLIDATGSTNPSLVQNSGPTAMIDSSGSPLFVIHEPDPLTQTMSFTLTGTSGGQTATETILIDPRGSNEISRKVWDGNEWA